MQGEKQLDLTSANDALIFLHQVARNVDGKADFHDAVNLAVNTISKEIALKEDAEEEVKDGKTDK